MSRFEQLLVKLEAPPWGGCYRVLLGFLLVPIASRLVGTLVQSGWALAGCLLGALFLTRAVPAILRSVIPFSRAARSAWGYRRGLGKRYDSYQWQKLLWIGLGMAGQILASQELHAASVSLSALCVVAGAAGWVAWQ